MEQQASPESRINALLGAQEEQATVEAPSNESEEAEYAVSEDGAGDELGADAEQPEESLGGGDEDYREDAGAAQDEAEVDGFEISTLQELAEAIEFDPADFYNLKVPITNPDGEREEVTIGQLKDIHQKQNRTARAEHEFKQQQEAFQQYQAQLQQQYANELQNMTATVSQLEDAFLSEFKAVDWARLRVENPQEYAAKSVDYDRKKKQIEDARTSATQRWEEYSQKSYAQQQQQYAERLAAEQQALMHKMGWTNEEQASAEKAALVNYLRSDVGISEQELAQVIDHRLVVLADKARKYDELQKKGVEQKKRVLKLNGKKIGKPGARQSKAQVRQDAQRTKRAALKKSGNVRDAAALIADRLK